MRHCATLIRLLLPCATKNCMRVWGFEDLANSHALMLSMLQCLPPAVQPQVPLMLWVCAVIVIFATSYRNLQGLQGPLASLDTVSHVLYRATRCRLFSCMMAFSVDPSEDARWRTVLKQELKDLRTEYNTLL